MVAYLSTQWLPSYLVPFFTLSYPTIAPSNPDSYPDSTYYNTGRNDLYLIVTCIAVMAVLRDAFRLWFFEPLARWKLSRDLNRKRQKYLQKQTNGKHATRNGNGKANSHSDPITTKDLRQVHRSVLRFAEQGWSFIYYTLQCAYGVYVHRKLPTSLLNPKELWQGYPHFPLAGPVKFYYLMQTAFYLHQILILNAEARRKDHVQMMTHHIITIILMAASYFYNLTRVGCLIMVLMDWCDIFLPLAKMIRYLAISQLACDMAFAFFLVSWLATRHILFILVIYSAVFDVPKLIPFKWSPEEGHYVNRQTYMIFCGMLMALQALQIIWFCMICRVAYRVVSGQGAADERSDEEEIGNDKKD